MEGSESEGLSDDFEQPQKKALEDNQLKSPTKKHDETSDNVKKSKVKVNFKCRYCTSCFTVRSNCTRHQNACPSNPERKAPEFVCAKCNSSFKRRDNLQAHIIKCQTSQRVQKKKTPCLIKNCGEEFYHKISLIEHLQEFHKEDINVHPPVTKTFSCVKEFNSWKEAEEERTFSLYSAKKGQAANSAKHFYCQHDGSGKPHSERKTSRRNNKGRIKVGHYCISKMAVRVDDTQAVHVEYYPTHNHKCSKQDLVHHPLPEHMSRYIEEKLAENTPATVVYELAREKFLPRNSPFVVDCKASILTKKRVLERGRRRRMARRLHKDDAKAVYLLATQLIDSEDPSVLIFKPYGSDVVCGPKEINDLPKSKDLFMFGFQTKKQLEIFKLHSGKIVILDETHGTNQYKYQLLNVMVVDENRRGWPVAHLITSRSDADTFHFFFQELKSRLGDEGSINCVITDDDPSLINGVNSGFSANLRHILCKWHVFKNFKDNIRQKAPKHLFDQILSEVKAILNAESESLYSELVSGFKRKYENNSDGAEFLKYFKKYYLKKGRPEKWAMAFRNFPHSEVNTTGHIESFHNRLKKVYLKRKVNKRLDDLINILYDVAWEDYLTREREATTGFSSQPQHIIERHQRSVAMDDETIVDLGLGNTWEMKSSTGKSAVYVVVKHKESCSSDFCFCRCTKPACHGLCAHLFSCSCPDHHPICKHIHKLQSFLRRGEPYSAVEEPDFYVLPNHKTEDELNNNEDFFFDNNVTDNSVHDKKWQSVLSRLQSNFVQLEKFIAVAQQKLVSQHTLVRVDAVLSDLVSSFGSLDLNASSEKKLEDIPHMDAAVKFTPNEKLKTQISQLAPFKRPAKRKRKLDVVDLSAKKKAAVDDLLTYAQVENETSDTDNPNELLEDPGMADDRITEMDDLHESAVMINNNSLIDDDSVNSNSCFTLSAAYVTDPYDIVLECGQEKISLIHLKSLELHLPLHEIKMYEKRDPIFRVGWLYSSIIDAFMFKLSENDVFCLSCDFAERASRGTSNADILTKKIDVIKNKRVILLPGNLTGDHWIILAIMLKENEIRYYDPIQCPISLKTLSLLKQTVSDLKTVFSTQSPWKIKPIKLAKQADSVNCGINICHFAKQTVDGAEYGLPTSPFEFRKYMYSVIVGNCLKRSSLYDESCGKCGAQYSDTNDLQIWVCCSSCQQWFHESCTNYYSKSCSDSFTCSKL
ncbi:Zinc finger protein 875 [Frankliniella fusca]|uniref:Zinc finger protein 875 n=1 Tax=Frankliniella fusca TaxID=407009 RepID=A0AAE1I1G4_9NEOP|nr:Zinc finger protein 875 [Frankliniella fusca]